MAPKRAGRVPPVVVGIRGETDKANGQDRAIRLEGREVYSDPPLAGPVCEPLIRAGYDTRHTSSMTVYT